MQPLGFLAVLIVMTLPLLYIVGEAKRLRYLRISAFVLLLPICVFVAWAVGMLQQFNYNAWYGFASQELIAATVQQLETGNTDHVLQCLKALDEQFSPTYENRANYDNLVEVTVRALEAGTVSNGDEGGAE